MASIQYVVSATDAASGVFAKIAASADGLDKQLADLSKRVATPEVDLKDAKFTLGVVNAAKRLDKLSAMVADPSVDVDAAKAQTEILRITAMLDRLDGKRVTATVNVDTDRGGLLSRILGSGGIGGLLSALSPGSSGGGGLGIAGAGAAGATIVGPLLVGLAQVVGALAAAGAGVVSFGALSIPQFTAVSGAVTQINADTAAYERATTAAAKSTALKRIRQDWADLTGPQRQAVHGIMGLGAEFSKLSAKLAPITFKVFNDGLKLAAILLPDLLPFARAAGNAFAGLLTSLGKFAQSAGFNAWLAQLQKLSGPSITALGKGLGQIAIALGKLILVSASPNSIKTLSRVLGFLAFTINAVSWAISRASGNMQKWVDIAHQTASKFDEFRHDTAVMFSFLASRFDQNRHTVATWGHDIAGVFDTVRHTIATWGHDIASAFGTARHAVATAGHDIASAFDSVRHAQGQFDAFGKDVSAISHGIAVAFGAMRHGTAIAYDAMRHNIASNWDQIRHQTGASLAGLRHDTATAFDWLRHTIAAAWTAITRNSNDQVKNGLGSIVGFFRGLPGRVLSALRGLGHALYAFGHAALTEFLNGFKSVAGAIFSWVGNFVSTIWNKVKKFFGISSPSSLFYEIGKNLMLGLFHGIRDHAHTAEHAAQTIARRVADAGSGVQRWAGLVRKALAMEGLSPALLGNVLYQMQTESGGNPNAINLTDSNARMGDPSRGLMQTIMSTFQAYHWPGTSSNIYDPLANIAAALNYARHVYGPTLMSGGMGIGSGHGYALGGVITEPIAGIGLSGQMYTFGERGPETVIPGDGMKALIAEVRALRAELSRAPARTATGVADALTRAGRRPNYSTAYGAGG